MHVLNIFLCIHSVLRLIVVTVLKHLTICNIITVFVKSPASKIFRPEITSSTNYISITMSSVSSKVVLRLDISKLPPLIVGGAVFNTQYNDDPLKMPCADILRAAFSKGFNALDTSPYYGPSETIIGDALKQLAPEWSRESYFICTKAGRVKLDDFDYLRLSVRASVQRSLKRLNTTYLDLVYMHDIEFVEEDQVYEALRELKAMKNEGLIRYFGVSGYPIDYLHKIAKRCAEGHPRAVEIGPLDIVMSYCHGCIQNGLLFEYYDRFIKECKLKKIMNGSILSMSMLRLGETRSFHPAPEKLKRQVQYVAEKIQKEEGEELADVATRYALRKWLWETKGSEQGEVNEKCSIVLGVSSVAELEVAISGFETVKSGVNYDRDDKIYKKVIDTLGEHYNETWSSGIPHDISE